MKTKTKQKPEMMVIGYLTRYKSLSRVRAATHFDIWNLPRVIFTVKNMGYKIETKGTGKNLTYHLISEEPLLAQ